MVNATNTVRGGNIQTNYNPNEANNSNNPRWEIFTCTDYKDFNNDGTIDLTTEVINKGKTDFLVGERFSYAIALYNCEGKELALFNQDTPGAELKLDGKGIVSKNSQLVRKMGILTEPANWHAYVTLDGVRIGDYRINVREDPARFVKNK